MNFLAIDVETANADYSSICQIGIAEFQNGLIVDKWSSLINPRDYFDPFNISIHGITEKDVKDSPTFKKVYVELSQRINEKITVHHMPFDKIAITRACVENKLEPLNPKWLDSAKIVRRTWEQFSHSGYSLSNMADFLEIKFNHHDALEDAIAAAQIVHHACQKTGLSIDEWCVRITQPIFKYEGGSSKIKLDGNPEGLFYGENLVFTGTLSITRREAGLLAANLGCNIKDSVTNDTTILVVGDQDVMRLGGYEKSSKHRKAEDLIKKGNNIKIMSEKDFAEMCNAL